MNKKLSKQALRIVLLFMFLSAFLYFAPIPEVSSVDNWLAGWTCRKSHVINSASGAGTGYQSQFTTHYGSGSDSGSDVYLLGYSQVDFDDVRFTESDGYTLLPYFLESKVDSDNAVFWVKISGDLTASSQTIYVYYGNSGASSISNADSTFGFYDGFLGSSLNATKWSQIDSPAYYTVHDSILDITNALIDTQGTRWGFWHTGFPYQTNFEVAITNLDINCGTDPYDPMFDYGVVLTNTSTPWDAEVSAYYHDSWVGGYPKKLAAIGASEYTSPSTVGNVATADIIITKLGNDVTIYWNGENVLSASNTVTLEKILIEASCTHVIFQSYPFPSHATVDTIRVRKYVSPEPTHGAWETQEYALYWVTFYLGTGGSLKVDGVPITNGTILDYDEPDTIMLEAYNLAKYYVFGNFTWDAEHSNSNPYSLDVFSNLTVWVYFKWSPSSYPPDFPSTPLGLQYLVNGNYLGFIHSYFTSVMGQMFYAFVMLVAFIGLYVRVKSIALPIIAWTLMSGVWAVLSPAFNAVPIVLCGFGIAGILFLVFSKGSEN